MKKPDRNAVPFLVLAFVMILLAAAAFISLSHFWQGADPERTEMVVEAIRKAAVQCYALEGSYPPDVDYLISHYGLQLDLNRYACRYEVFASNIMPEIEVHER
jgi:hypothetical protein